MALTKSMSSNTSAYVEASETVDSPLLKLESSPMMMMGKSSSLSGGVKEVRGRKAGPDSLVSSSNA